MNNDSKALTGLYTVCSVFILQTVQVKRKEKKREKNLHRNRRRAEFLIEMTSERMILLSLVFVKNDKRISDMYKDLLQCLVCYTAMYQTKPLVEVQKSDYQA